MISYKRIKTLVWLIPVSFSIVISGCISGKTGMPPEKKYMVQVSGEAEKVDQTDQKPSAPPEEKRPVDADKPQPQRPEKELEEAADAARQAAASGEKEKGKEKAGGPSPEAADTDADAGETAGTITLNFDNADLYEVIRVMADILGINYIVDPGVSGRVTIHTAGKIKRSQLLPVFYRILDLNGLTAVKQDGIYNIIKSSEAAQYASEAIINPSDTTGFVNSEKTIQIVSLAHISAEEVTTLIKPFISANGTIVTEKRSNTIIIVDRHANMPKLKKLIDVFDVNVFAKFDHAFYPLDNIAAKEAADILGAVFNSKGMKEVITFIPVERTNTVIAISEREAAFKNVKTLLDKIDTYHEQGEPRIYVYPVKNGQAEELSDLLHAVFEKAEAKDEKTDIAKIRQAEQEKEKETEKEKTEIFPKEEKKRPEVKQTDLSTSKNYTASASLQGEVRITPDTIRNTLIIEALPADYKIVERILNRVDILPRQVLIEVVIAEVTLNDDLKLGIEWSYNSESTSGDDEITANLNETGLSFKWGISDKLTSDLSAFAQDSNVNIISSPRILASDNKEAKINVSTQVPVATTEYNYDDDGQSVLETTIQYKDTGVILSVTPHINERKLVTMELSQEVSEIGEDVTVGDGTYSSFSSRTVDTTLTVRSNQTIVIGGMMKESRTKSKSGLPFLSRLPVFGFLFGKDHDENYKTEMIIVITPRVITDLYEVDEITRDFKNRVNSVIKEFSPSNDNL